MKNFDLSLLLGCCAVSAGIIIAGNIVGNHLPPVISGSFSGVVSESTPLQYADYLSEYEASAFLMVNTDDFQKFVQSGELKGTFTTNQGNRVFSKEKLSQWMNARMDQE